jgi:hypothetical protein
MSKFVYKFNLGDEVFIKRWTKKGIVVGTSHTYNKDGLNVTYSVRHLCNGLVSHYLWDSCADESVQVPAISTFKAEDLEKVLKPIKEIIQDFVDIYTVKTASQEDLDKLSGYFGGIEPRKGCSHSWKLYEGFTKSYHYCEKCDVKKP